jgi:hypothetical protein
MEIFPADAGGLFSVQGKCRYKYIHIGKIPAKE